MELHACQHEAGWTGASYCRFAEDAVLLDDGDAAVPAADAECKSAYLEEEEDELKRSRAMIV